MQFPCWGWPIQAHPYSPTTNIPASFTHSNHIYLYPNTRIITKTSSPTPFTPFIFHHCTAPSNVLYHNLPYPALPILPYHTHTQPLCFYQPAPTHPHTPTLPHSIPFNSTYPILPIHPGQPHPNRTYHAPNPTLRHLPTLLIRT